VVLTLGTNAITSASPLAFKNLAAFAVYPSEFEPKLEDGSPFRDQYGIGVWPHTGKGSVCTSASAM